MKNEKWYCPVCKSEIIDGKVLKYQTLNEHVCNPNGEPTKKQSYICGESDCICNENDIFWDDYGDLYGNILQIPKGTFINENNAPFGSHSRQSNVEIYKYGLKKDLYFHPIFGLWFVKPYIDFHYKSNTDGDVLSRRFTFEFLTKPKGEDEYYIGGSFWYGTFKYLMRKAKNRYINKEYTKLFDESFNRDFIYRFTEHYIKLRYLKTFLNYKN